MALSDKRRAQLMAGPYTRLLAEHEKTVADYYSIMADALTGQRSFWLSIADEELAHQRLILRLDQQLSEGELAFKRPVFLVNSISDSITWLIQKTREIQQKGISMQRALQNAVAIEENMLESSFFHILDSDTPQTADTFRSLANYTEIHLKKLKKEAGRFKWKIAGRKVRIPVPKQAPMAVAKRAFLQNSLKTAQAETLGLLVSLEESISSLYSLFASRLPDAKQFWSQIATEELQHAAMLRQLYSILEKGNLFYNLDRFANKTIRSHIDFVIAAEHAAQHGSISPHKAIVAAIRVENMLTESSFYKIVKSDSAEFRHIAKRLGQLTDDHVKRLRDEMGRTIDIGEDAAKED